MEKEILNNNDVVILFALNDKQAHVVLKGIPIQNISGITYLITEFADKSNIPLQEFQQLIFNALKDGGTNSEIDRYCPKN